MKKRLFALLLAAVMVLGLAATAFAGSEDDPAESPAPAETAAGPDSADLENDAVTADAEPTDEPADAEPTDEPKDAEPTDEPGDPKDGQADEDGTEDEADPEDEISTGDGSDVTDDDADMTDDGAEVTDDGTASDDTDTDAEDEADPEDEARVQQIGESQPLADGEPQAAAETDVTVTLHDNMGRELSITLADGTDFFQSGGKVPQEEDGEYVLKVSPAGRDIGVTVEGDGTKYYALVQNGEIRFRDSDKDGEVTITLDSLEGFQLFVVNDTGVDCTITDPRNGDATVNNGDWVYVPNVTVHDVPLKAALDAAYSFDAGPDFVQHVLSSSNVNNLTVQDNDRNGKVTLTVVKALQLHIGEGAGIVYVSSDQTGSNRYTEGTLLKDGQSFFVKVKSGLALEAEGATAKPANFYYRSYDLDPTTGTITRLYEVMPKGTGSVTLTTVPAKDKAPTPVKLEYGGKSWAYVTPAYQRRIYAFPGEIFNIEVRSGYGINLNGEPLPIRTEARDGEIVYFVEVAASSDSESPMVFEGVELPRNPKLAVDGDASALEQYYAGKYYAQAGQRLSSSYAYVLVKNGYKIDEKATKGGTCMLLQEMYQTGGPIYRLYYVQASGVTLTLKVVETEPSRWVRMRLVNDYPRQVTLDTYSGEEVEDNVYLCYVDPNEEINAVVYLTPADAGGSAEAFTVQAEGGIVAPYEGSGSDNEYSVKVNDGVDEVVVRVALNADLEVKVPDAPAAGVPGVPDKAAAEEKLMDTVSAVVDAALKGETPAGVSKADAAAIAQAAADGKTITTQLEVTAVTAPADAAALRSAAGEDTITQYVDIQIVVLADGKQIGHITETAQALDFAVVLSDEELAEGGIFYVLRAHGGATSVLNAQLSGNVLRFSSDRFSTFAVANSNDIAFADVEPIADQTWTGSAVRPAVKVTANGSKTLTEGVDYTVSYKNNVNSGTATVVITGIGAYTGTKEVTFRIVAPARPAGSGTAPATGDETPLALYAGLLALSAAGLALVLGRKKRTEK